MLHPFGRALFLASYPDCEHSNKSYCELLSCDAVQGVNRFSDRQWMKPYESVTIQMKETALYLPVVPLVLGILQDLI